jgi:tRNA 2-thiouridine synthesizing protein A
MKDAATHQVSRTWQAGETGCSGLIVGLKREIAEIEPDELLKVTALDAGARVDIRAWCRMTGHSLVAAEHPTYILRRKPR